MNKRLSVFFNFFAFNLLFFALYLNFIYKDVAAAVPSLQMAPVEVKTSYEKNAVMPAQKADAKEGAHGTSNNKKNNEALRLSMN